MDGLVFRERPAEDRAQGVLVLHHGRGADEHDLLALGEDVDPERRLHVVTPRAPLRIPGWPGNHWYVVPRVGYPDPDTFRASQRLLASLYEELWHRTGLGPQRTVFGGFSMGSVLSYAMGLDSQREPPAGIMAFSGFVPQVEGWHAALGDRESLRVFISHGRADPVIGVQFARSARTLLEQGGVSVDYHEFDGGHHLDGAILPTARGWLAQTLA